MAVRNISGEEPVTDPCRWSEDLARECASHENIKLTEARWEAIKFMRQHYAEHQTAPEVRHVIEYLAERAGAESRNAKFDLFPYGYVAQTSKLAGLHHVHGAKPRSILSAQVHVAVMESEA
jgi:tRNA 2-thiouridine synthesizing protein E